MIALLTVLLGVARGASAGLYIYLWATHFSGEIIWSLQLAEGISVFHEFVRGANVLSMMTIALFLTFYYGMLDATGWTSLPAKIMFVVVAAWFASVGILVDIILMPLAALGWLSEKLSKRRGTGLR